MIYNLELKVNSAIILAGGSGVRMSQNIPKQFIKINNKMILEYSLDKFISNKNIDEFIIVCNQNWYEKIKDRFNNKIKVVIGGETRSLSSYQGLINCHNNCKNVLIHDAARPLITQKIINDNISTLNQHDAAVPIISNDDSLINSETMKYLDRDLIKKIQTPQGFRYKKILNAYNKFIRLKSNSKNLFKDDFSLLLNYSTNLNYLLYNGEESNFKITNQEDIIKLKFLLKC